MRLQNALPPKPKPTFGRKQYDNSRNNPVGGVPKAALGNYSQQHGVIKASALSNLQSKLT